MPSVTKVLVMGWRTGIGSALDELGVPYAVWNAQPLKNDRPGVFVRVQPFGATQKRCRDLATAFVDAGPFSHVIAGVEDAVVAASYVRRHLGARLSRHSTVIRCHDKLQMKAMLHERGVRMTPFCDGNKVHNLDDVFAELGAPLILKDRKSSGGRGLEVLRPGDVVEPSQLAHRLLEAFVDAPEASVECLVENGAITFSNITNYYEKKHINLVPADFPDSLRQDILHMAKEVIETLEIQWGMTHIEVYLTSDGPLFGEIALRPPGGYIMDGLRLAYDFDPWLAFVRTELGLPADPPSAASRSAATVIFHPGPGIITKIAGWEQVKSLAEVVRAKLKVAEGDVVGAREGLGNDIGYAHLQADTQAAVLAAIEKLKASFRVELKSTGEALR